MAADADRLILSNGFGIVTVLAPPLRLPSTEHQPDGLRLTLPADLEAGNYVLQINNFRSGKSESVRHYLKL